jgi:hypothetical protein
VDVPEEPVPAWALPDGTVPDGTVPDGKVPDGKVLEGLMPGAGAGAVGTCPGTDGATTATTDPLTACADTAAVVAAGDAL